MQTIKIFLASSSELKDDREQFEIFISRKNKEYIKDGVFLELVLWEDFLDAMSQTRLQDEYNKAIAGCDVFVSLFHTKVGKYTEEEFLKALETFQANGRPLIYTYFKDEAVNMSKMNKENFLSLRNFQDKLKELQHFPTHYADINDLKFQFNNQLTKFLPELTSISSSRIEQHSENKPQTVTKVEQHFHGNVGIATGNIEGNQNLKDINTEGDRKDIHIKTFNNPRLKSLQKQKEQIESQISELEELQNRCNQDIQGTTNADTRRQLRARIKNYSTEINELYDEIDNLEQKISKLLKL
ncbi:MAG: hypothetical protein QNJ55_18925 [Xenococcus sp. MO_188.B8]|nr:hypothetical protein [Xenococcus sp. MO_188.B8]